MQKRIVLRLVLLLVLLARGAAPALAHPAPYSYLDLHLSQNAITATLTAHTLDLAHELNLTPAEALLDSAVVAAKQADLLRLVSTRVYLFVDGQPRAPELLRVDPVPERQAVSLQLRWPMSAMPGQLRLQCSLFPYDPQHQTFLNIYEADTLVRQEVFNQGRATFEHYSGTRQGVLAAVRTFLRSGVAHIFAGPDHILFLIGLLLLGGSLRRLLLIVTAFTVAHSVTLSLAALNLINPPARVSEAAIALSIIYVGLDNLLVGATGRDVRGWIAFCFGLVHGFGFANVLREFGLPGSALGWSLFSFNLGVEIGQVCIVVAVATALAILRQRQPALSKRIVTVGSVAVSLAGCYWFIQRVFGGG